jgi:DNA repair protein RecN (Recombination protein N)
LKGGRRFFINNQPATFKTVNEIADILLSFNAQHSSSKLLKPAYHMQMLDSYGKLDDLKKEVYNSYNAYQDVCQELTLLSRNDENVRKEIDYLEHVVQELNSLNIQVGEEEKLSALRAESQKKKKFVEVISHALSILQAENVVDNALKSQKYLSKYVDNEYVSVAINNIDTFVTAIDEAVKMLESAISTNDHEVDSADNIEERLFLIRNISRKYNITSDKLHDYLVDSATQLENLKKIIYNASELREEESRLLATYLDLSAKLHDARIVSANNLEQAMMAELQYLEMKGVEFKVVVEKKAPDKYTSHGMDSVSFVARTNIGMEMNSIDKIASGGELSRFMLAMQVILGVGSTIVLDEVDTGIAGDVADAVGRRLKFLGEHIQVLAITNQKRTWE